MNKRIDINYLKYIDKCKDQYLNELFNNNQPEERVLLVHICYKLLQYHSSCPYRMVTRKVARKSKRDIHTIHMLHILLVASKYSYHQNRKLYMVLKSVHE